MYPLESMIRAIWALQNEGDAQRAQQKVPELIANSASKRFDATWDFRLMEAQRHAHTGYTPWQSASTSLVAQHKRTLPVDGLYFFSHVISNLYISCAFDLARARERRMALQPAAKMNVHSLIETQSTSIMHHNGRIIQYLDALLAQQGEDDTLKKAAAEYFSIAIVALHEMRTYASSEHQIALQRAIERCELIFSDYGLVSIVPAGMATQIRRETPADRPLQHGPQQPQRLMPQQHVGVRIGHIGAQTGAHTLEQEGTKVQDFGTKGTVVSLDKFRKPKNDRKPTDPA